MLESDKTCDQRHCRGDRWLRVTHAFCYTNTPTLLSFSASHGAAKSILAHLSSEPCPAEVWNKWLDGPWADQRLSNRELEYLKAQRLRLSKALQPLPGLSWIETLLPLFWRPGSLGTRALILSQDYLYAAVYANLFSELGESEVPQDWDSYSAIYQSLTEQKDLWVAISQAARAEVGDLRHHDVLALQFGSSNPAFYAPPYIPDAQATRSWQESNPQASPAPMAPTSARSGLLPGTWQPLPARLEDDARLPPPPRICRLRAPRSGPPPAKRARRAWERTGTGAKRRKRDKWAGPATPPAAPATSCWAFRRPGRHNQPAHHARFRRRMTTKQPGPAAGAPWGRHPLLSWHAFPLPWSRRCGMSCGMSCMSYDPEHMWMQKATKQGNNCKDT